MGDLDLSTNTSGGTEYHKLGDIGDGEGGVLSVAVWVAGSPPTLLGQVVQNPVIDTGANHYIRFTTLNTERYSSSTGNSATADIPIIRVNSAGVIQYQHNDGSSAQIVSFEYMRKKI